MRLPWLTFGLFNSFSLNFGALGFACFGVFGALVEDALDGKDDFGKVGGRPAGETRNKRFNH